MTDVLYDQRDLMVMMYCEMHGMPGPEDFTGLGPFQGVALRFVIPLTKRRRLSRSGRIL